MLEICLVAIAESVQQQDFETAEDLPWLPSIHQGSIEPGVALPREQEEKIWEVTRQSS